MERLDDAVDLRPILEALLATGQQVFIAVPDYYPINTMEVNTYDAAIHTL